MGSSVYYLSLAVATVAIGIFNFNGSSEGKPLTCYNIQEMDYTTYVDFNNTMNNIKNGNTSRLRFIQSATTATTSTTDPTQQIYTVNVPTSNIYTLIATIIAIIYLIITGLSLYMAGVIYFMSNQLPEDFMKVGMCKKCVAIFCKIIPVVIVLLHWLILILVIVLWVMLMMKQCQIATSTLIFGVNPKSFYNNIYVLNIVNSCIWILLHYGGAIFREVVYQEPFMYVPDPEKFNLLRCLCKKLGP
jgi:hypothetical protein